MDELYDLLNREDGYLRGLSTADSINGWRETLHSATPAHVPTNRTAASIEETALPGQKRKMRKSERAKWLSTLLPLREAVRYHYYLYRAATHGLTACLVWNDARFWFGIAILFGNPEPILWIPIQVENDEADMADAPIGQVPMPYYYGDTLLSYSAAYRMAGSISVSGEIADSLPTYIRFECKSSGD